MAMPRERDEEPGSALDALFWRDELLQAMFWMKGEGIGDAPRALDLAPLLNSDPEQLQEHLERMVDQEYLVRAGEGYSLTERGRTEGAKLFLEEFAGLTNQAHGECNNPNCACKTRGPEYCESRTTHTHV